MRKQQITAWVLVLLWMSLIFYFSHQPGDTSSELSGGITETLLYILQSVLPVTFSEEAMHTLIRKGAHFFVYFVLGILTLRALHSSRIHGASAVVYALCICILYAITDEVHQLFIPGRAGTITDVAIDSAGAAAGIALYLLVSQWWRKK
ncbi:VanZ family protein [Alkalicoccus daliensis]|uniref:VanZ like family protein n=1 Tax=Alkalicoccus daliensis TaxID=745820 RepID=A0A1H0J6I9_9BACI|nr:VanZ family protein [Alkalicoccus daliensis]SDO39232.1 VanZ like family protein [Alkalicoccus daliensis]